MAAPLLFQATAQMPPPLKRTPIVKHNISPDKNVTSVSVVRIDYQPAQRTGRHLHPMPVIGYVLEGSFVVKISGGKEVHYTVGQSIYEPADTIIEQFDNDSSTKPAVLIARQNWFEYCLIMNDDEFVSGMGFSCWWLMPV